MKREDEDRKFEVKLKSESYNNHNVELLNKREEESNGMLWGFVIGFILFFIILVLIILFVK